MVLIVDEAQNLSTESLEQVRLLTNLETPTAEAAADHPARPAGTARRCSRGRDLRQLAQRITARYPPDAAGCGAKPERYVRHRLAVAGCPHMPFSRSGIRRCMRTPAAFRA